MADPDTVSQDCARLQSLDSKLHWFCPRTSGTRETESENFFPEDLVDQHDVDHSPEANLTRDRRIKEAKDRKWLVLRAMLLFSFNGEEAWPGQRFIETTLADKLEKCSVCVREFHRGRAEFQRWLERYVEPQQIARAVKITLPRSDFSEEDVRQFMLVFDDISIRRIRANLRHAKRTLLEAQKAGKDLTIKCLDAQGLNGFFEVLHCLPVVKDEAFLKAEFDEPFALVSQIKRLKVPSYSPAMAWFLWSDTTTTRGRWARQSWDKFHRNIAATEFEHSVREPVTLSMSKIQLHNLNGTEVPKFWTAMNLISKRLDKNLVTHNLHSLEFDVCKLALDHLQLGPNMNCFLEILSTITRIIEISPDDFWTSSSANSPPVWIDQFFSSSSLHYYLSKASGDSTKATQILDECFGWLDAFIRTINLVNQAAMCRPLFKHLIDVLPHSTHSSNVRDYCFAKGMTLLTKCLNNISDGHVKAHARTPGVELGDIVAEHLLRLTSVISRRMPQAEACGQVIRKILTLDCKFLINDRQCLLITKPLQQGACAFMEPLWTAVVNALRPNDLVLACSILHATSGFAAVEPFLAAKTKALSDPALAFNRSLHQMNNTIVRLLEKLSDFEPDSLDRLFRDQQTAASLFAHVFSSEAAVRNTFIDVLKAVTEKSTRTDALHDVLSSCLPQTLNAFSRSLISLSTAAFYSPTPAVLVVCKEILQCLCDSSSGLLRSRSLDRTDKEAVQSFWSALWHELITIFSTTESWSRAGYDKAELTDFCIKVMELANFTFDQFGVFAGALSQGSEADEANKDIEKSLIADPRSTMDSMVKWLRLRDPQLLRQATDLVCQLMHRLRELQTDVTETFLEYLKNLYLNEIKSVLGATQKAQLRKAWEATTAESIAPEQDRQISEIRKVRHGTIDLDKWEANAQRAPAPKQPILGASRLEAFKNQPLQRPLIRPSPAVAAKAAQEKQASQSDFLAKRKAAAEEKKRRDLEAVAKRRREATQTTEEGSGLQGLGVYDKEHAPAKGANVMVSSDESSSEEESEDEMDRMLFGIDKSKSTSKSSGMPLAPRPQGPVKKKRVRRNASDMRARLVPDLSPLHKSILGWEYFHAGAFPSGSDSRDYAEVMNSFRDPSDYQHTFQPLLLLEAWNGFLKAKGEDTFRPFEVKIINRSTVDAFVEISTHIDPRFGKDVSEGDVMLLSRAQVPQESGEEAHALAYLSKIHRKKSHIEAVYRALPKFPIVKSVGPNQTLMGLKVMSIVPLEREYGALQGLQYYDLCDEIVKAKPSPLLKYRDETLSPIQQVYQLNKAQAKSVKSAVDNDCFTLIQGPPGSGKTKTITAIVGAILSETLNSGGVCINETTRAAKKLLVCAPSNAAVDELVIRLKGGVKTTSGSSKRVNVVRLGRSDAVSSHVLDVTLDELVTKRMNPGDTANKMREETQKIMMQHQDISARLREARALLDAAEMKQAATSELTPLRKEVDELRRGKTNLSNKIDGAKDAETQQSRQVEMQKRQIQQEIISESHIICATLSGSGHDMFQNLNVEFETVVIDEAAQCVELSSLIPLKYGCAKCIMVGDPQQLPPTVFSKDAARFKYEQSLFVRMQGNSPDNVHLLDTQYRMHPEISRFPSQAFYHGRLLDGPNMAKLRARPWHSTELLSPFRFFDVQGQQSALPKGKSLTNHAEIRVAESIYDRLTQDFRQVSFKGKVGIITPYKAQLRALKDQFRNRFGNEILDDIEFNTTDAFQGRESEIIIFSCVRASPNKGIGFLNDIRRMNVGLTRAKSSLWVLGNSASLMNGEFWAKMIEHAKEAKLFTNGNIEAMMRRPLALASKPVEWDQKDDGLGSTPVPMEQREKSAEEEARPSSMSASSSGRNDHQPASAKFTRGTYSDDVSSAEDQPPRKVAKLRAAPPTLKPAAKVEDSDTEMPDASDSSAAQKSTKSQGAVAAVSTNGSSKRSDGKSTASVSKSETKTKVSAMMPTAPATAPKRALPPHLQKKKPKLFIEKRKP